MDTDSKKSKVGIIGIKSQTQGVSTKSVGNVGQGRSVVSMSQGKSLSRVRVRRQSFGFGSAVAGIRAEHKYSQLGMEYKRPPLLFLNTYQLEPHVRFHVPIVEKVMNEVLDIYFTDHKYSASESPGAAVVIAGEIMRHVKRLGFDRYRIISVVTIAQKKAQSYNNAVAFLWDHERDGIANTQREVISALIQATVFGVYLD